MTLLSIVFVLCGSFTLLVAAIGAIRLPDFYTRANALGVVDTVGTLLLLTGIALYAGFSISAFKILLIIIFIQIANPAATHILLRAAMRSGLRPWMNPTEGQKK